MCLYKVYTEVCTAYEVCTVVGGAHGSTLCTPPTPMHTNYTHAQYTSYTVPHATRYAHMALLSDWAGDVMALAVGVVDRSGQLKCTICTTDGYYQAIRTLFLPIQPTPSTLYIHTQE